MKKTLTVFGLILALTIPVAAFAAASNGAAAQTIRNFCGITLDKLTDQQKNDLDKQRQKMLDLKKETINKMVANGALTKEQGASAIKQIETRMQNCQENGFAGNRRGMDQNGRGRGMGRGCRGNGCWGAGYADSTVTK